MTGHRMLDTISTANGLISRLELCTGECNGDSYRVVFFELFIDRDLEPVRAVQSGIRCMLYVV